MDETRASGMSVLRTWAFCDGAEWTALQPAPGEWDERVSAALDWVIAQAGARGLRLILALTNYWAAYGGIKQYVRRAQALCMVHSSWAGDLAMQTCSLRHRAALGGMCYRSRRIDLASVLCATGQSHLTCV